MLRFKKLIMFVMVIVLAVGFSAPGTAAESSDVDQASQSPAKSLVDQLNDETSDLLQEIGNIQLKLGPVTKIEEYEYVSLNMVAGSLGYRMWRNEESIIIYQLGTWTEIKKFIDFGEGKIFVRASEIPNIFPDTEIEKIGSHMLKVSVKVGSGEPAEVTEVKTFKSGNDQSLTILYSDGEEHKGGANTVLIEIILPTNAVI